MPCARRAPWRGSQLTAEPAVGRPGAIRAHGLAFRFASRPVFAFEDVSFEVEPGECLLIVGPSGSGKSTLALALAGLVPREFPGEWRGRLTVDGLDPATASGVEVAARVGLVFQDPESQLVMDRVEDDVAFGLESRGWDRAAMHARVPEALGEVGLAGFERRRTTRLSGGQQQRLALAGALAPRPGILVLDEPTANLDPPAARAFAARLAALRAARAVTIVLVEHRVDVAWPIADRVLALGPEGRPIDVGRPADVLARSRSKLVAAGAWLPDEDVAQPPAVAHSALASGPVVLAAHDLAFAYDGGADVVRGVDFALTPGERVALVGTNGSGKSTLAKLLVGLLRPRDGEVRLAGDAPADLAPAELARRAAYVFQDPEQQFARLRVDEEVMLGLDDAGRRQAAALMDHIGLPLGLFGPRSPYTLSGGEQRRLSLATALVRSPSVIVLDEPTFGQDRRGHDALLDILRAHVDAGAAVLAATHDERFIEAFASRIARLEQGRIVHVETADGRAHHRGDRRVTAIIDRYEPSERQLASVLGRTSPLVKLAVALVWLVGLAFTLDLLPPVFITIVVLGAGHVLGGIPGARLATGVGPLWIAALGIGLFNALFSGSNSDPTLPVAFVIGPFTVTWAALAAGVGLAARVIAIASVGVVFGQTTDSTHLVDALVQQARAPERFAYGALAAYQAIPRLAEQLTTLRQARRMRGLRWSWHPRLLVGLLVLAIRHGDRLALAMDARAFGSGPRSRYRVVHWTWLDAAIAVGAAVVLAIALRLG